VSFAGKSNIVVLSIGIEDLNTSVPQKKTLTSVNRWSNNTGSKSWVVKSLTRFKVLCLLPYSQFDRASCKEFLVLACNFQTIHFEVLCS
jgi:hypothetical protein